MKILTLTASFLITASLNAQLDNHSLIVPEFGHGLIKLYLPTSSTSIQAHSNYTIDLTQLGPALSTAGSPNCTALLGNDLFVSITGANQRIYRFPNYLLNPTSSIANVTQVTNIGNDYVGIVFDSAGNLYASEGESYDTHIVRYNASDSYATRIDLGNGQIPSYFANFAFDASGNLWASDYRNNRIIAIAETDLATSGANFHSLSTNSGDWATNGGHVENTNAILQNKQVVTVFAQPEGIAFDSNGLLWVANNNDLPSNENATLVRISISLQTQILATLNPVDAYPNLSNSINGFQVWNVPSSQSGASQLGGIQIDKIANHIFINEEISNSGLSFDLATLSSITDNFSNYQLGIVSTNPGNGGITLAPLISTVSINELINPQEITIYPNPTTGICYLNSLKNMESIQVFDQLGKEVEVSITGNEITFPSSVKGIFFLKYINKLETKTLQVVVD
ncbi:T9SS type A sorting domain-containing protein [Fluviicola taffensis]|uniref:NHL repeat containing protein n=1 Tax=Fluviicola taffensis (strain DSM 16823 / NCIMB 13979 / RW262) TaxID=755732 RepID=F2IIQ3_FLUTR|nr:T9SS type A sorting domain-containing protein [Fluviicola taffensis]AEA46015.1 NHL repeat containing protein [Fluviicola taffensis DSM 16823]